MGKLDKGQVLKAIKGSNSVISTVAKRCGVDWHTANQFIKADQDLMWHLDCEKQKILDLAESRLHRAIAEGELWAIKYILSTKGKSRGYIERQEIIGLNEFKPPETKADYSKLSDEELSTLEELCKKMGMR